MSSEQPPLPNYFELLKNIAQPFFTKSSSGASVGDHAAAMAFATLDVKEVERKIAELETVHAWLKAQGGVIELSIKTLEYQKSFLENLATNKDGSKTAAAPDVIESIKAAVSNPQMNPALWAWNLLQQMPVGKAGVDVEPASAAPKKPRKRAAKPAQAVKKR